jgi:serine/threonine protein kinase
MPAIIKCLSAVLDIRYGESEASLGNLLVKLAGMQEILTEKKKRLEAEQALLEANRKISRLQHEHVSQEGGPQGKAGQAESKATVPVVGDPEPDQEQGMDQEPEPEKTEEIEEIGVKHPYLGWGTLFNHPYVVMRDMGATLHDLVTGQGSDFCARWRGSQDLRAAFLEDVGRTALNLVTKCGMCHNDIRPPNIAFADGRFCLLDFDMSSNRPQFQEDSAFSPKMASATRWLNAPALLMCYSVAQMAVNVFILDSGGSDAGPARRLAVGGRIWSAVRDGSAADAAFERWAEGKGALVHGFIAGVRETCLPLKLDEALLFRPPTDFRGYFAQVLSEMLA